MIDGKYSKSGAPVDNTSPMISLRDVELLHTGMIEPMTAESAVLYERAFWKELHIDKLRVPIFGHILLLQGMAPANLLHGDLKSDVLTYDLTDWDTARCSMSARWTVPHYLYDVVMVLGDSPDSTMRALLSIHKKH